MEKLIVKNFGPIKEAEIDLTKYVVFIGDTSTGKSVLAKLISIFRDSFYLLSFTENFESIDFINELKRFNINFDTSKTEIYLTDKVFGSNESIKVLELIKDRINMVNNSGNKELFDNFKNFQNESLDKINFSKHFEFDKEKYIELFYSDLLKSVGSTYFPAERILYSLTGNSLAGLMANNVSLPTCYKDFAAKYEVARKEINTINYTNFDLIYEFKNGLDNIKFNNNTILLSESSSGIQSLVPLLVVLENEVNKESAFTTNSLIIEEPELNLFPVKQKILIAHIVKKVFKKETNIVITTHSPYILSALDTLILAKNTYNEHPELKEEINKIVSEDKWIDYDDISVYEVTNDGKVHSIKNEEYKSIDANAIDSVSDIISEEFEKLTDLRYAH